MAEQNHVKLIYWRNIDKKRNYRLSDSRFTVVWLFNGQYVVQHAGERGEIIASQRHFPDFYAKQAFRV